MQSSASRRPELPALRFFEAAGRLLSFTRAAQELHVTQGAVSRQIRLLEDALGVALFNRHHRAVELTDDGRRYHRAVSMSLAHIHAATEEVRAGNDNAPIVIAATHAVATYWLLPRLDGIRARLPGVDVKILASDAELDSTVEPFDIAIRYGSGEWPGVNAERLGEGRVFAVCAPRYLAGRRSLKPAQLIAESLLHLDDDRWDWMDWPVWFRELGVSGPYPRPTLQVNSYPLLIAAAVDGHGIALGWKHLSEALIANGSLVHACPIMLETGRDFYAVTPRNRALHPATTELQRWLVQAYTAD